MGSEMCIRDRLNDHQPNKTLAIVTYGNGTFLSRKAANKLLRDDIKTKIIDLRWLVPLPIDRIIDEIGKIKNVLIVDECRKTGSPSEELLAAFAERELGYSIKRICGEDTFIPLGPAADAVLVQENDIVDAARALIT